MAVFFDIQGVQSAAHGERGIARYLTEVSLALERWHPDSVARYLLDPQLAVPGSIEPLAVTRKLTFTDRADASEAMVYHVGSPFEFIGLERIWPRFAHRTGMRLAVTLYDLIPALFPDIYLANPEVNVWYRTRLGLVRRADRVLAISEATARDAIEQLGLPEERVVVVGAGVSERFHPPASRDAALSALQEPMPWLEEGYVLYTGGIEPRKNIDRLLEAYAGLAGELRAKHQLVIVCRVQPSERALLDAQLRRLGVAGQVRFPGFVPDEDLMRLYQAAELFVFPALYEGFGLPIAEAMASGAPVIAARSSSLTELVQDDEALFEPRETESIRAALERALTDDGLREHLRSRKLDERHTWRGVAERMAGTYEELIATGRRPVRARPRIAVISPLPPQRSGIAHYTYRMLDQLREHCDIDAFVETDPAEVEAPPRVSVDRVSTFEAKERVRAGYDTVVFCLGNSEFHAEALDLLRRRRSGVVLAHDVRLSGLYSWTAAFRPELLPHGLLDSLHSMYMHRVPPDVGLTGWLDYREADRYGIYMAREAIGLADRYLVHSDYAAQVAMLDSAPGDERKVERIQFRFPDPHEVRQARPDEQAPVIVTVGVVAEVKQTAKVVEAFGQVAERHPNVTLAVVGPSASEAETQRCHEAARRFGVEERVRITGPVDDDEFRRWLEQATLAVQLREHSNGETQATIADCLAAGIPTVVTALGSARELPDDVVAKVEREISAPDLAEEMSGLLADRGRRQAMVEAGLRHAAARSFATAGPYFYERLMLDERHKRGVSRPALPERQPGSRLCKLCEIEDFEDLELRELMREAFATQVVRFGSTFPTGVEWRKYWEVAMSLRALSQLGVLRPDAELLGVGAGAEATCFWLTRHVRRVFATDLYIDNEEWATQTPPGMLLDPAPFASCEFEPRRLVVQHMNALELGYEDESFDGVFSSSSIEHFGDLAAVRRAFEEMHRVLKPGGVVTLSTEYRVAGEGSLPGTLLFDQAELQALWEGLFELVEPLHLELTPETRSVVIDFDEAAAELRAGREWSRYPHILLMHQGQAVVWTSVHVALRKLR